MAHGHLKCNSLSEMIRAVRKGRVRLIVFDVKSLRNVNTNGNFFDNVKLF